MLKKLILLLFVLLMLLMTGCYATVSGYAAGDGAGYWHCVGGYCHWHEYGILEDYYVPFYGRHYYIAPPPPSIYITPRYYHRHRYYRPAPPSRRHPTPPHYHR